MEKTLAYSSIALDTLKGLSANPKYLLSKYFYDDEGSRIFQKIMDMPEYYLTNCEIEIFETHKNEIVSLVANHLPLDIIELGSGDGLKTKILLQKFLDEKKNINYLPIDISKKANDILKKSFSHNLPDLHINPITGDYFNELEKLNWLSSNQKLILFLGSNIGNFQHEELSDFLTQLANNTRSNDFVLIGFDLMKTPEIILNAYDDPQGFTRDFNLNHLRRINRELKANFNRHNFKHQIRYNQTTGEVKSYLVSQIDQEVTIGSLFKTIKFTRGEKIFMELSRKFNRENIEHLAEANGFSVIKHFKDKRGYFINSLWKKK